METQIETRQVQTKPISAREMHKYVWILVGVFTLIAATFPTALIRVSKDKKFAAYNFHVKSLTLEGKLSKPSSKSPDVQLVANNPSPQTASSGNTDKTLNPLSVSTASQETQARNLSNASGEITDSEQLAALNQKLYDQIAQVWEASRHRFEQQLEYRVSVSQNGAIASYEPLNQAAQDYLQQTALPNLRRGNAPMVARSSAANSTSAQAEDFIQEPVGYFRVVFTRKGILEVSPWQGWSK